MNSICMRVFAVLLLAWLIAAAPVPQPAINTEAAPVTDGGLAAPAVGSGVGSANADAAASASRPRRVTFGPVTVAPDSHVAVEPEVPASDQPRLFRTKSSIRLSPDAARQSGSTLPVVKYEGDSLIAPESAPSLNSGPASSDSEMAHLLENRPLTVPASKEVAAMTSDLPEHRFTLALGHPKPIMTLSGNSKLDSAALTEMTKEGLPFYVENGLGKVWDFKKTDGGFTFTSELRENPDGKSEAEEIKKVLAERRSALSDAEMSRLLAARPQSVNPSDEVSRMVDNLPIFKQRKIMTLSGDFGKDSNALAAMTRKGQPFYVTDRSGNVGAFVGRSDASEGLAYLGKVGEDTQQGVLKALDDSLRAAESSAAAASSDVIPRSSEALAGAQQGTSSSRTEVVGRLQQPETIAFPKPSEGSAAAPNTIVREPPRIILKSPEPRPIVARPVEVPRFKTWVPFVRDPVEKTIANTPRLNGRPIFRNIAENDQLRSAASTAEKKQLQGAAWAKLVVERKPHYIQRADGGFNAAVFDKKTGTFQIQSGVSEETQQQLRQALAKRPSWWSRMGESSRNSLASLSSSVRKWFRPV